MSGERLTIGAVGVGAVGSILAACLAEAGAEVVVADIPRRIAQVNENGLQVNWNERQFRHKVATVDKISSLADAEPDCIFIATKACIINKIMPEVVEAAGDNCTVMSVHNGIGTEDEIARFVKPDNVGRMVINYAGGSDENGNVKFNWFNPPNSFGPLTERENSVLGAIVEHLNSIGLESVLLDSFEIKKKAFLKTVLNSALMPLCATMGLTMKEAMDGVATRKLAGDLLGEGFRLGKKLGFDYGEEIREKCIGYLDKGGDHHPSMSVDLRNERRTEIEFINGKILEIGRQFDDLDLEVNRVMVSLLISQEVRNGTRKPDEIPDYLLVT